MSGKTLHDVPYHVPPPLGYPPPGQTGRWLDAFFGAATAGMAITDRELRYVFVNEALAAINGQPVVAHLGRRVSELLPTLGPSIEAQQRAVITTGKPVLRLEVEGETPAAPGLLRHWLVSWFPLRDLAGAINGLGSIVVETTTHKQTARALEQSQAFISAVVEQSPDVIFAKDLHGHYLMVNRAFEQTLGRPRSVLVGSSNAKLFADGEAGLFQKDDEAVLREGRAMLFEQEVHYPDGPATVLVAKFPLRHAGGDIFGLGGIVRDLSEQKRAEARIRFQASLLDQVHNAVIATDVSGRVVYWNRFAEQLYQWTEAEAVGRSVYELTVPAEGKPAASRIMAKMATESWEGEFRVRRKDGKTFIAQVVNAALHGPDGEVTGFIGVSSDITERKCAEFELRQSREQLRALATRLSEVREEEARRIARELHDELGQQLTALKMELTRLDLSAQGQRSGKVSAPTSVREIISRTDRMLESVQKISSEIRLGQLDRLGLGAAIEAELVQFEARSGISCDVSALADVDGIPPEVATAFFRIFQEALTNIARHAAARGVAVAVQQVDRHVLMTITDNGIGISPAAIANANSIGLLGMRERAIAIGAEFSVRAGATGGTIVGVRAPLGQSPLFHEA